MEQIQLDKTEKKIIKFCKGHYKEKYPFKGSWVESFKPLFLEIYGWDPDEDNNYHDYLTGLFGKLLELHLKIKYDRSGHEVQLKGIFSAAFSKSIVRTDDLPIERAISELCGLIQNNLVYSEETGQRYNLD